MSTSTADQCPQQLFRHDPIKHHDDVFWAIAGVTQLTLFHDEKTTCVSVMLGR
jgi:hypothetical protein